MTATGTEGQEKIWIHKPNTTVSSYSETNQDVNFVLNATITAGAQSFSNTYSSYLTTCKFYLRKTGSPTGNMTAKLYAHTGTYGTSSKPTGAALATSDVIDVTTLTTSYGLVTFTFSDAERYNMAANTYYCIVIDYAGGGAVNQVWIGCDSSATTAPGNFSYYNGAWVASNTYDACFYVYATEEKDITEYHYGHNIIQRLNELWNFELQVVCVTPTDKTYWIAENHHILIFWGESMLFKGRIEKIAYDNYEVGTITGPGMAVKLRDRDIDTEYTNTSSDTIVEYIASKNTDGASPWLMEVDTNTDYGLLSLHFASENKLKALAATAEAADYDWWEDWKSADNYLTDYVNVDDNKGDPTTAVVTLTTAGGSQNIHLVNEDVDTYETTNYVTVLGSGDGNNQLKSISYHATDNRTTLTKPLDAILNGAINGETETLVVFDNTGFDVGDTISVDGESMTISAVNVDGVTITVAARASKPEHADGAEVIKTTGDIHCVDTSSLGSSGNVWIGQEKISYSANASDDLTITSRGVDYAHSRIKSPYYHGDDIEVVDAQYTDDDPEVGSYINLNDGVRSRTFINSPIISQNLLDYIAQRLRIDKQEKVNMITVACSSPYDMLVTTGLVVGDWVELEDTYTGFATGTNYEVVGLIFGFDINEGEYCKLEISNYSRTLLENSVKETDNMGKYYKGATNIYQVNDHDDCDTGYPLEIPYYVPSDAVAINKVLLSYKVAAYRAYSSTTANSPVLTSGASGAPGVHHPMIMSYTDDTITGTGSYLDVSNIFTQSIGVQTYDDAECLVNVQAENGYDFDSTSDYGTRLWNATHADSIDTDDFDYVGLTVNGFYNYSMIYVFSSTEAEELDLSVIRWEWNIDSGIEFRGSGVGELYGSIDHTHTVPAHAHAVTFGISETASACSDIAIWIDNGDGTGYQDKTAEIEAIYGVLSTTREQDIEITTWMGRNVGWKGVRIQPTGKCRVRGDIYVKTFVQSKT